MSPVVTHFDAPTLGESALFGSDDARTSTLTFAIDVADPSGAATDSYARGMDVTVSDPATWS